MNIFLVSSNTEECAQVLDDLRLNKMILETGQMLCTAYRYYAPKFTFDCSNVLPRTTDVFANYKQCLINKWCNDIKQPTWVKRGPPEWSLAKVLVNL